MAPACQMTAAQGTASMTASQKPWRTVGRILRKRRAPRCWARTGVTPVSTPIAKRLNSRWKWPASAPAASASGPSQPIMTMSVVMIAI